MAIGTSLGAYFDDAFHHQAGINTDPSQDHIDVDPEVDTESTKPKPKLDIMKVSDTQNGEPRLYVSPNKPDIEDRRDESIGDMLKGFVGSQFTMDKLKAILQHPTLNVAQTMTANLPVTKTPMGSDLGLDDVKVKDGSDLPDIDTVPHHDFVEGIGKSVYDAVTFPGDVYSGKVDIESKEGRERLLNLTMLGSPLKPGVASLPKALTYEERFGMTPEQAADNFHNLPRSEQIPFAHHYEEHAAPHEWNQYEGMVNDQTRQVPFDPRDPMEIASASPHVTSPHAEYDAERQAMSERMAEINQGPSPFEQVVNNVRRGGALNRPSRDQTEEALRQIHEALQLPEAPPIRESFDELMARLDREDAAMEATRNAGAKNFKDYGKVQVADRGFGSFLFKAGDSKVLPLRIVERNNGKTLYVNWVGDQTYRSVNKLGNGVVKGLVKALADKYPNAEEIAGFRISGARTGRSDTARMKIPGRKQTMPERKSIEQLTQEWDDEGFAASDEAISQEQARRAGRPYGSE